MKFYDVYCSFKDGSSSQYHGLSHDDLVAVVNTFETQTVVSCFIQTKENNNEAE